jgi:hypothetical protein
MSEPRHPIAPAAISEHGPLAAAGRPDVALLHPKAQEANQPRNRPRLGCDFTKPRPSRGDGWSVDRVVRALDDIVGSGEDHPRALLSLSPSIETTKSLAERIQTGALSYQAVEVQVGASLNTLGSHHDQRPRDDSPIAPSARPRQQLSLDQTIPVDRPHPSGDQDDVCRLTAGRGKMAAHDARRIDPVDDDRDN